ALPPPRLRRRGRAGHRYLPAGGGGRAAAAVPALRAMKEWMPFVVAGLTTGAVYALAATGLVVTYTTSGVFNFAHGAVGLVAAVVFYGLRVDVGMPTLG